MTLRFGTDGLRGRVGTELTPDLAHRLGRAAAQVLGAGRWCIGRDTRESGPLLEDAVARGLADEGAEVELLGVVPTPAIALVASRLDACAVVVSASHNPWHDNGLKLFGPGGRKLTGDTERAIEAAMDRLAADTAPPRVSGGNGPGSIVARDDAAATYVDAVVAALGGRTLEGRSLVLDCGHGAATPVAGEVFRRLGADVQVLHAEPDGRNINNGVGSTDPSVLSRAVVARGAEMGLAFDGDADRLIAVDGDGEIVDGDRLMCLFAVDLRSRGELHDDTLVVTVMSNLGLQRAMRAAGINVHVTPVGDRHVLAALQDRGYSLGGEQSGHLIFMRHATTGDGVLAGAMLADLVARAGRPLAAMAAEIMVRYPQVLVNVRVAERHPDIADAMAAEIEMSETTLGEHGRVLVRASGTEPLIRVMVEAENEELADAVAQNLAGEVARKYGRHPSR